MFRLRAPRRAVRRHQLGQHARVMQHAIVFHLADEGRAREERDGAAEPGPDLAEARELEVELCLVDTRPASREDKVGAALDHDETWVGGVLRPRGHVAPGQRLRLCGLPAERRYCPADDDAHRQPRRVERVPRRHARRSQRVLAGALSWRQLQTTCRLLQLGR